MFLRLLCGICLFSLVLITSILLKHKDSCVMVVALKFFDFESFSLLMNHFAEDEEYRSACGSLAGTYVESLAGATNKVLSNVKL